MFHAVNSLSNPRPASNGEKFALILVRKNFKPQTTPNPQKWNKGTGKYF
jgi:hypothetical protein